jgi:hypothetical protein
VPAAILVQLYECRPQRLLLALHTHRH